MARETSQNADLDFEQMMGELDAMKTDLAHRQASRSGSRSTAPRSVTGADGEPRRTRTRRAPTEPRADLSLSVNAVSAETSVPTVATPVSPLSKYSDLPSLQNQIQNHSQDQGLNQNHDQKIGLGLGLGLELGLGLSHTQGQGQAQEQRDESPQQALDEVSPSMSEVSPSMSIDAANVTDTTSEPRVRTVQALEAVEQSNPLSPPTQPAQVTVEEQAGPVSVEAAPVSETMPSGSTTLGADGRRPLPPKSAQRSRSISIKSSRLSQTGQSDNGERAPESSPGSSTPSTPQEIMTPTFGPPAPRKFLRPYPQSPSLSSSNGQMAPPSPRLPARSNSRRQPQAIIRSADSTMTTQSSSEKGAPSAPPAIPPRSRSGSSSLSRSNTITRTDGSDQAAHPFQTPTIAEVVETIPQSPKSPPPQQSNFSQQATQHQQQFLQHPHQQQPPQDPQQPQPEAAIVRSSADDENKSAASGATGFGQARKMSSNNGLRPLKEENEAGHSLEPSVLPDEL
ncbi:hypothetical protein BGZ94_002666, partial [Podila epigama]